MHLCILNVRNNAITNKPQTRDEDPSWGKGLQRPVTTLGRSRLNSAKAAINVFLDKQKLLVFESHAHADLENMSLPAKNNALDLSICISIKEKRTM